MGCSEIIFFIFLDDLFKMNEFGMMVVNQSDLSPKPGSRSFARPPRLESCHLLCVFSWVGANTHIFLEGPMVESTYYFHFAIL